MSFSSQSHPYDQTLITRDANRFMLFFADGTFNLGNPMESRMEKNNSNLISQLNNHLNSPSLQYNGTSAHRNSFVLSQKAATNVKRVLNGRSANLESKNNRLNSSFIVSDPITIVPPSQQQQQQSSENRNLNSTFELPGSSHQFSTITKVELFTEKCLCLFLFFSL